MLNYIWAGLIVFSLLFAIVHDVRDEVRDTYRNGRSLPVRLDFPEGVQPQSRRVDVVIRLDPGAYQQFYGVTEPPEPVYDGYIVRTRRGIQLRFDEEETLPEPLATIRTFSSSRDDELQGALAPLRPATDSAAVTAVRFEPGHYRSGLRLCGYRRHTRPGTHRGAHALSGTAGYSRSIRSGSCAGAAYTTRISTPVS